MRIGWLILGLVGCSTPEVEGWTPGTPWEWEDVSPPTVVVSDFIKPMGLCLTESGTFWVADESANVVRRFSADGDVLAEIEAMNAPRWLACGGGQVVVSEADEMGQVGLYNDDGSFVRALNESAGSWGRVVYGDGAFSWIEASGSVLYQWDGVSVEQMTFSTPIQAFAHTPEGWLVAAGSQSPWLVLNEESEVWGTSLYALKDLEWHDGKLWGSTRSPRWPFGGWIVRWDESSPELVQYSPPEPGPMTLTDNAIFWGSKQTLTRFATESDAYESIALQTAVAEVISSGTDVFWTDYQRGVLLTWTD